MTVAGTDEWMREQDDRAREELRGTAYEALKDAIAHGFAAVGSAPRRYGDLWFRTLEGADGTRLLAADEPLGDGRVLLHLDPAGHESLEWWWPSPDGSRVAIGVAHGGDEQCDLRVVDVATATLLRDRVPHCSLAVVAWLPDSSGFWFNRGTAADTEDPTKVLCRHVVGAEPLPAETLVTREQYSLVPQVSPDGRWVAAVPSEVEPRPDYVRGLPHGEWTPFLRDVAGQAYGCFLDDAYVAVVTEGADRGRVVRIPVPHGGDPATWTELVAESDLVLRSVEVVGDALVVCGLDRGWARIRVHDLDGTLREQVRLPDDGVVLPRAGAVQPAWPGNGLSVCPDGTGFTFVFSSPRRSPAAMRYDVVRRELVELSPPATVRDDLVLEQHQVGSAWYDVIRRTDVTTPAPTVVYAYGGWNIAFLSGWLPFFQPWLDAGGVLVVAHLRGGGEGGAAFWHEGRLADKQQTFDDLYAVAEDLVSRGTTTTDQLGLVGGSNGGLLAGVAVTQRPELFGAVAALVPVLDMLGFDRDPYARTCVLEYGDPQDPDDREVLAAYSPLHHVTSRGYPAVLVHAGANDMRCPPWHARDFVAALREHDTGGRRLLLRAAEDGGHLTVTSPAHAAEWLGFLMTELGLAPTDAGAGGER